MLRHRNRDRDRGRETEKERERGRQGREGRDGLQNEIDVTKILHWGIQERNQCPHKREYQYFSNNNKTN